MVVDLQDSIEFLNDFVLRSLDTHMHKSMSNLEYNCSRASATTE
jgi:hypothetical protein